MRNLRMPASFQKKSFGGNAHEAKWACTCCVFRGFAVEPTRLPRDRTRAAGPASHNRRRSPRPRARYRDDEGVCPDDRPDGLPLGMAARQFAQSPHGLRDLSLDLWAGVVPVAFSRNCGFGRALILNQCGLKTSDVIGQDRLCSQFAKDSIP